METLERFNQYFNKTDGCWNWTGSVSVGGYGKFWLENNTIPAHRASFILHKGQNPDGKMVLHTCDNPRCVNPDHLVLGTHHDNARHMKERGRFLVGEQNSRSKITVEEARNIIRMLLDGGKIRTIAKSLGHSRNLVKAIAEKITWKHIWKEFDGGENPHCQP